MEAWLLERIGDPVAGRLRLAGRAAWATGSGYIRGVAVVGLFDAAFIGIGLLVLGVPLVLSLARRPSASSPPSPPPTSGPA
jgi:predicted PurR-regulated permease PerM